MIKRYDSLRFLRYSLLALLLSFIFGPLNAEDGQLIQVRKGDTISYLSFKIYGMYDTRIEDLLRRENPQVKDLNMIYTGQQLRFPAPEAVRKMLLDKPGSQPNPQRVQRQKRDPRPKIAQQGMRRCPLPRSGPSKGLSRS